MLRFILTRLTMIIPTFIGVTIAAFTFVRLLPGDPVLLMAGERGLTEERYAELLHQFGYDRPLWQQYLDFLWRALNGDLGRSLVTKNPVFTEFMSLFPATLELSGCAMLFAIAVGVPAGMFAAVKRGTALDHTVMGGALVGIVMLDITPVLYWNQTLDAVTLNDVLIGVGKSAVFGVVASLIAVWEGYNAIPTAEGVGRATTRTVVVTAICVLILDFMITAAFI